MAQAPAAGHVSLLVRRIVLRTGATPLRSAWVLLYRAAARSIAASLSRACPGAAVYLKGSLVGGHALPGLSDIDLVVVAPPRNELALSEARVQWQRLVRRFPPLAGLVPHLWFYREECLARCLAATVLTAGLDDEQPAGVLLGPSPPTDEMGLLQRPGLENPRNDWVSLAGPERRPAGSVLDAQERRLRAWLELQEWWRYAFVACSNPASVHTAYVCVKLVAEPARIMLWLDGETPDDDRLGLLELASRRLPEEEEAFRRARELYRELSRSPAAPLPETLSAFVRLSALIAERLAAAADEAHSTAVRIEGVGPDSVALPADARDVAGPLVPLADWRACVVPESPDEVLAPQAGSLEEPAVLAKAAAEARAWLHPALRGGGLLVLPTSLAWSWGRLRAIQCPQTDPVSFALLDGTPTARFPELAGWSALDCARRAVAEHRSWLAAPADRDARPPSWIAAAPDSTAPSLRALGMLFTAARAALFLQSLEDGDPALAATTGTTARLLESDLALEAHDVYVRGRRDYEEIDAAIAGRFRELVVGLPAYRSL